MKERAFLKRGRTDWQKLEAYAARVDRLPPKELLEFVSLYRRATSDLARARTLNVQGEVVDYLNALIGRLHFQIYTAPDYSLRGALRFFSEGFPRAVRANRGYVLAATLLLLVPAAIGYVAVVADPSLIRVFAPPQFADLIERYGTIERRDADEKALYTSFYISNNVRVSFMTFASGILFGFGSLYFLCYNGVILGAMLAGVGNVGQSRPFVSFISAHGGIELAAIVLAGAAGLRIGAALINPGLYRRGRALANAGKESGLMMFGVVVMLLIAAFLEAWVSPTALPDPLKWATGIVMLVLVILYFVRAGREEATEPRSHGADFQ